MRLRLVERRRRLVERRSFDERRAVRDLERLRFEFFACRRPRLSLDEPRLLLPFEAFFALHYQTN